ncbi:MAG TPA: macrolide ABC transporter ATP-binding protein [Clostridiales bacterium]|nr:ABC transporter ATP-binding protein [Clostridia bacterium]HCS73545.1 macrolide ABC transporter ATP-binding protein [Clostridiales bacterium]
MIKTENISRQFQSGREIVYALRDINMEIQPKALTILRGRSGSGKTTLINLMGALDTPTRGKIYFNDMEITRLSEIKRDNLRRNDMGFIFQSIALMPLMTAYENVEFSLRVAAYDPKDRRKRAEDCLTMVGLQKRMHHLPQELSGGEQQRVAIARAIAHKPDVVFADEPTAELDTSMGLQVVKVLKDLVTDEGLTVIMTTHDPSMIEIADYVYTLDDGMIIDTGE